MECSLPGGKTQRELYTCIISCILVYMQNKLT